MWCFCLLVCVCVCVCGVLGVGGVVRDHGNCIIAVVVYVVWGIG